MNERQEQRGPASRWDKLSIQFLTSPRGFFSAFRYPSAKKVDSLVTVLLTLMVLCLIGQARVQPTSATPFGQSMTHWPSETRSGLPPLPPYCSLLNQSYPPPPAVRQNVSIVFSRLCSLSAFSLILSTWGGWSYVNESVVNGTVVGGYWEPRNFTILYNGVSVPTLAYFQFNWISSCNVTLAAQYPGDGCSIQEIWTGHLQDSNLSGPSIQEHVASSSGYGPSPRSSPFSLSTLGWLLISLMIVAVLLAGLTVARSSRAKARDRGVKAETSFPSTPNKSTNTGGQFLSDENSPIQQVNGSSVGPEDGSDSLNDVF